MASLGQLLANGIVLGCVYIFIAIGLTMVYGILKILHIAHAAVYTIGAAVGLIVFRFCGNFWVALPMAMLASGVAGVLIYQGVYRRMLDAPRIVPLITSIGLFILAQDLLQKDWLLGPYMHAFPAGSGFPAIETRWFRLTSTEVLILALAVAFLTAVYLILTKTRIGLGWRASAQDREMAAAVGVNINRVITLNFLLGSALAGAAGVLVGLYYNNVYATMGDVPSYKAFVVIVLGGMGSVTGTIVAGLLLALAETFLVATVGFVLPRDAIAFLVLILVLMFRPRGLFGRG
ncbi:MAG: branched-chain amino acid ABC transporter permease [Anaerolineae bacterium]